MIQGQCFPCYDDAMFQYFGQTGKYSPALAAERYAVMLERGKQVHCVTCDRKVQYVKDTEGRWTEEPIKE